MATSEKVHTGEFIIWEADRRFGRDKVTIKAGQTLDPGAVLGKITMGAAAAVAFAGNAGNGAMGAIVVSNGAKPGAYKLVFIEPATNLGKFIVFDPDGVCLGVGTAGTEFSAGGLTFTLADGATDWASGDGFTITVAAGSGKYVAVDPEATDGSQVAVAVLYDAVDASGGDKTNVVILARDALVNEDGLGFSDLDSDEIATAKAQLFSNSRIRVLEAI